MLEQTTTLRAFIGGLGPVELIIILVIVLLIFGPMKLPQIGDALGKSVRSFRKGVSDKGEAPVDVTPKEISESPAQEVEVETAEEVKAQDA
ncbi:MAG: twin-arginine translocase TatA/TatE family subunit [Myxococcota bacterium]|nr:twin-arginine translocase TatA/TatE family subunit [Myxococcota bacterium]